MVEIKFVYKNISQILPVQGKDLVREVYEFFSKRIDIDIENLSFYHNKKKIKFAENNLIEQAFDLLHNSNCCSNIIKVTVAKNPFYVTFFKRSEDPFSSAVKEKDKMKDIFKKYAKEAKKDISKIFFLYDGNYFSYKSIKKK